MCERCGNLALIHAGCGLDRRSALPGGGAVAAAAPFIAVATPDVRLSRLRLVERGRAAIWNRRGSMGARQTVTMRAS